MWRTMLGLKQHTRNTTAFQFSRSQRIFSTKKAKEPSRMAKLAKEYGWTATGVYVALSFIDLPLSYLLVHSTGQERLENAEISIRRFVGADTKREHTYIHKSATGGRSHFLTEFGIAYVIHKALVVVRGPLTVAITPTVARKLGQWGFSVKRAVPSIDKNQVAAKIASKANDSNSAAVKKAADIIAKDTKTATSKILRDAVQNEKTADSLKCAAKKVAENAPTKDFGQPPSSKRRGWWLF